MRIQVDNVYYIHIIYLHRYVYSKHLQNYVYIYSYTYFRLHKVKKIIRQYNIYICGIGNIKLLLLSSLFCDSPARTPSGPLGGNFWHFAGSLTLSTRIGEVPHLLRSVKISSKNICFSLCPCQEVQGYKLQVHRNYGLIVNYNIPTF